VTALLKRRLVLSGGKLHLALEKLCPVDGRHPAAAGDDVTRLVSINEAFFMI
jgi:hypothetical protein